MSTELATISQDIVTALVINGDLKKLSPTQKVEYYNYRARQAGLDPAAKPFDLLMLKGREILYANAGGCQQMCSVHKLSTQITHREKVEGVYCVSARVTGPDGRSTENMGSVFLHGLAGDDLANAMMKATTKAIRRTVLSHLGLGMMEESEVETIPGASRRELPVIDAVQNKGFAGPDVPPDPSSGIPLNMPNMTDGTVKVYSTYSNLNDWETAYQALMKRCEDSPKLNDDGKTAMKMALHQANIDVLNRIIEIEKDNPGIPNI